METTLAKASLETNNYSYNAAEEEENDTTRGETNGSGACNSVSH
jgi:hypothetical protein